ncbi:hypothetical protein AB0957_34685 [Streptomyces zhihengii]|uniref:hypothetical protein n=1 Tax=Streptomyces zhihengii TaxID=1818004 RepID=UPI00345636DD
MGQGAARTRFTGSPTRQEFFDAMDAGELDFSEIVETTGPRNTDGSPKHGTSQDEGNAA